MASDEAFIDSLQGLSKVMSSLRNMTEPKGISYSQGSVLRDNKEKEPTSLSTGEQRRLAESATIIGKILKIGAFREGPEATRLGDLTASQAQAKQMLPTAIKDRVQVAEKKGSLLDTLLGVLGSLGGLFGLGKAGLFKTISKWLGSKLTKVITFFGKQIGKVFKWMGGKLWSLIKWVGGKISKALKWVGSKAWNAVKWLASKIKNLPIVKKLISKLSSVGDIFKSLFEKVTGGIKGAFESIGEQLGKLKGFAGEVLGKIPGFNLLKKGVSSAGEFIGKSASAIKRTAVEGIEGIISAGKGKIGSFVGKLFKGGSSKIGSFFKGIPVLGPLIEGLFTAYDIKKLKEEYAAGKLTLDDLRYQAGRRVLTGITGMGGAALGAAAGTAIGGPIGTIVGGVGGDILGRYLGGLLIDNVLTPDITKKLGAYVTQTGEMQDFLVRNGQVYKFSTKDEILGMKTGGAVDTLFANLTKGLAQDNNIIKQASIAQVDRLDALISLMTQFLQRATTSTTGTTNTNFIQPPKPGIFNIRDRFSNQTLIPTNIQPA